MDNQSKNSLADRNSKWYRFKLQLYRGRHLYFMLLPAILWFIVFAYIPMYGIVIAFQDFLPGMSFFDTGNWVGLKHFINFFSSPVWIEKTKNTVMLNLWELVLGFPAPIIFALLLNELRGKRYKRTVQTVSYLPHFVALVIVMGILTDFLSAEGLFNAMLRWFQVTFQGLDPDNFSPIMFLNESRFFRPIYVLSGIWQAVGWGSILYLSALSSIDVQLYEAAEIDGASRFRKLWHVTLPGISPTIIIMLIFAVGSLMNAGYEKLLLLYRPLTYDVSDTLGTYLFRKGLEEAQYSYSAAVNLMLTIINFILVVLTNQVSKKVSDTSLW